MADDYDDPMNVSDATIFILEKIQASLVELTEVTRSNGDRLDRLERNAVATHDLLGIMDNRLAFIERASAVTTQARTRLESRVDALEVRVEKLEFEDD